MNVTGVHLRDRMRLRTASELQEIIRNEDGAYAPIALEVASEELATREAEEVTDDIGRVQKTNPPLRSVLPVGLWLVFCFATLMSVVTMLVVAVVGGVMLANGVPLRELLVPLTSSIVMAAFAAWTAVAVRAEHGYVRILLLSFISAGVVYEAISAIVAWRITLEDLNTLGILVVAFWYFAYNEDVVRYYGARRRSRVLMSSPGG